MKTSREQILQIKKLCDEVRLDFINNYATISKFVEHNGITKEIYEAIATIYLIDDKDFNYPLDQ